MSAAFSGEEKTSGNSSSNRTTPTEPVDIREGDWKSYLYFVKRQHDPQALHNSHGTLSVYKRECALAYLGRRAQLRGGVCCTVRPHILTPQFIASLEGSNKAQRFARYPWLESLLTILADIERIQDELASASNVISMVGVTRT